MTRWGAMNINWQQLDSKNRWTYRDEKVQAAKKLGYDTVLECMFERYKQEGARFAAEPFDMQPGTIGAILRRNRLPRRERGSAKNGRWGSESNICSTTKGQSV